MATTTRFVVVSDTHGDEIDPDAERVFFQWLSDFRPTIRIHAGDAFDFRCFRRKASSEEQRDGLGEDIDAGCDFLTKLKPTVWLRGNHDERLWDVIAADDKKMAGLCGMVADTIADAVFGAQVLPYNKRTGVYQLGNVAVIHGYSCGLYAAKQAAHVYDRVLMGHTHTVDYMPIAGTSPKWGRTIGCLCKLDLGYNRSSLNTLRQAHGWGYGLLHQSGDITYWQAQRDGDAWILPSEMKEYR